MSIFCTAKAKLAASQLMSLWLRSGQFVAMTMARMASAMVAASAGAIGAATRAGPLVRGENDLSRVGGITGGCAGRVVFGRSLPRPYFTVLHRHDVNPVAAPA
jgi:hypothetical protein